MLESVLLIEIHRFVEIYDVQNYPAGKIAEEANVEECIFVYMALHFQCRFNKNSLLQC